jgi:hypothetical protein
VGVWVPELVEEEEAVALTDALAEVVVVVDKLEVEDDDGVELAVLPPEGD